MAGVTALQDIPTGSVLLVNANRAFDYLDRYAISVAHDATVSTDYLTLQVFQNSPAWVNWLIAVRNALVKPFGLRTPERPTVAPTSACLGPGDKAGMFTISHRVEHEIVLAEQDRHLDFRVSVHQQRVASGEIVVSVTTAVWFNNVWGRLYFSLIRPFHCIIVRTAVGLLRRRLLRQSRWPTELT